MNWGTEHGWANRGGYWWHNGVRTNFIYVAGAFPWFYDDYYAYYSPYGDYPYWDYYGYNESPGYAPPAVASSTASEVQSILKQQGYYSGAIDGAIGSRSRSAIMDYQRANGLPVTGRIDHALLSSMGL